MSNNANGSLGLPKFHRRNRPRSPNPLGEEEEQPGNIFQYPDTEHQPLSLRDIDIANNITPQQPLNMATVEDQLAEFQRVAERQQQQLQQFQQQQIESQRQFELQQQESQRRHEQSQATIAQLSAALATLTTHAAALPTAAIPAPQRKKPEMPPFDAKHVNRWIKRLEAAYQRAGVSLAKDKFAFLESTFEVTANPRINKFLYGTNTDDDWKDFLKFLREEYGQTKREKAALLISDYPRQGLTPSQYMAQMEEDTEGISLDDIKKEQLLKTLPARIRELLGREVESWTANEVATKADAYFDKRGNLLERTYDISAIDHTTPLESTPEPQSEDGEINQIHRPTNRGSYSRPSRTNFRPSASRPARSTSRPAKLTDGLCRSHYKFGDEAYTCVAEGCKKKHLLPKKTNTQGNGRGERRQ